MPIIDNTYISFALDVPYCKAALLKTFDCHSACYSRISWIRIIYVTKLGKIFKYIENASDIDNVNLITIMSAKIWKWKSI